MATSCVEKLRSAGRNCPTKRRLLLLDQNELNRQAFGLIVVGQFLPADLSFSTQDVAINTLSEWA
ncbi:MAG: hypothetical protein AAFU67_03680, partial [Bacteroidota bacterium]